jgi:hypothetical protein
VEKELEGGRDNSVKWLVESRTLDRERSFLWLPDRLWRRQWTLEAMLQG